MWEWSNAVSGPGDGPFASPRGATVAPSPATPRPRGSSASGISYRKVVLARELARARLETRERRASAADESRAVGDPSHLKLGDKSSRPSGGMMSGSSFSSTSKATSSKIYLFASASASSSSSSYGRIIARLHSPRRAAVLTVYIHLTVVDAVSSILTPRARTYDSPDLARSPTALYRALTVARGSIASPTRARA